MEVEVEVEIEVEVFRKHELCIFSTDIWADFACLYPMFIILHCRPI